MNLVKQNITTAAKVCSLIFTLLVSQSCLTIKYSFNSGGLPPDVKTFSVDLFENEAAIVTPGLSQNLTEAMRDRMQSQTNLKMVQYSGDLKLAGSIIEYQVTPLGLQGNEGAAQNRLTITLSIDFTNEKYPEKSWKKNISNFADFDASINFSSVEETLVEEIIDKLTIDIFNKVLGEF